MPFPLDLIFALLYLGYHLATPGVGAAPKFYSSLGIAAAFCLAAFLIGWLASAVYRRLLRDGQERRRRAWLLEVFVRIALVTLYAAALDNSRLPESAGMYFGWAEDSLFWPQLFGVIPYLGLFFSLWLPLFGTYHYIIPGCWTRREFILHQARYNLFILAAWLPFTAFSAWLNHLSFLLPIVLLAVAWIFPAILRRIWGCRPLTNGPVFERVRELEKRAGCRFHKIFLWEPGGGTMMNAAAVGLLPPFRYLFLTQALVDKCPPDELDAVILHELGHLKHWHLFFYLVFSLAGINAAFLLTELIPGLSVSEQFIFAGIVIAVYFRLVFGWLSRTMERQADIFALDKAGRPEPMMDALERIALAAGNVRRQDSWHHIGIADRARFLRECGDNPEIAAAHNQKANLTRIGGYAFALVFFALTAASLAAFVPGAPSAVPARGGALGHWRRVAELLPDEAVGYLEVARLLASHTGFASEAERYARLAQKLAQTEMERKEAADILRRIAQGPDKGGDL